MGKGDRKTRKGKIWRGTFGVTRRKKKGYSAEAATAEKAAPKKKAAKKK